MEVGGLTGSPSFEKLSFWEGMRLGGSCAENVTSSFGWTRKARSCRPVRVRRVSRVILPQAPLSFLRIMLRSSSPAM